MRSAESCDSAHHSALNTRQWGKGVNGLLVVAGGGTGGHLFPGLAVACEARRCRPDQTILYVGRDDPEERERVRRYGFEFKGLRVRGLQRRRIHKNAMILYEHSKATLQMKGVLGTAPRGAVLGAGGYTSAPAVLAAWLSRWPYILHEQNSYPGVVTRYFSSGAAAVCTTYEESHAYLAGSRHILTGMPVRPEVLPPEGWARGPEPGDPPCVLIVGGSQGARALVNLTLDAVEHLEKRNVRYRLVLQTGTRNQDLVANLPKRPHVRTVAFIEDMASAYKEADLLACRAGAGTLAEAALWRLPALVIPLPTSVGDHQRINALHYERAGGARVLSQDVLDGLRLATAIQDILQNAPVWSKMKTGMSSQARPEAALKVLQVIEQVTGGLS